MRYGLAIVVLCSLVACEVAGPPSADTVAPSGDLPRPPGDGEADPEAPNDEPLAIVTLSSELLDGLDQALSTDVLVILEADRSAAREVGDAVERELPERFGRVLRRFDATPVLSAVVHSREGLEHLRGLPGVRRITEDVRHEAYLAQSLSVIGQPAVAAAGRQGAGTTVAVVDTGARYDHAAFGSCTAPGAPAGCRVVAALDFAPNDGQLDDASNHGTNVSAITLGVAPAAQIAALDVFGADGKASTSTILTAIDWIVANRITYNIVAANFSLGSGAFSAACGSDTLAMGMKTLWDAGVVPVVATGNDGYTNKVGTPSCSPDAISVGAVYDANVGGIQTSVCVDATTAADKVTCFSNAAPFVSILAPGGMITAGGFTMAGTSQASPHVAGAVAVLAAAFPDENPLQLRTRLVSTGVSVKDARNGLSFPRLDLGSATAACVATVDVANVAFTNVGGTAAVSVSAGGQCPWTASTPASWLTVSSGASGVGAGAVTIIATANLGAPRTATLTVAGRSVTVAQGGDSSAPAGSVVIAEGAATAKTSAVSLSLSATDDVGVTGVCLSTSATACTTWLDFATTRTFSLASGNGAKSVYARFRDAAGNVSAVASDSIVVDAAAPANGKLTATAQNSAVALSWSGFTDPVSGIASYTVVSGATAPANCSTGTVIYAGLATSATATGLTNGSAQGFRVCATDVAGNLSTGVAVTATPAPELVPPTGTVTLNGGAVATSTASVTLAIVASDASTITAACVTEAATCTTFSAYAPSRTVSLSAGDGKKTVKVYLRDEWGNTMTTPTTASIILDTTAPVDGKLTAKAAAAAVNLSWTVAKDTTSGLALYKVVAAASATAPANCTGTAIFEGTGLVATHSGLVNGTTYAYRICAKDVAGKWSAGAIASARPLSEFDGPTGTITIEGGAASTVKTTVAVALTATDATGVTHMCLSTATSCTAWTAYKTTATLTLPTSTGLRTVRAWFKDTWGTVSAAAASDTITVDLTPPKDGPASVTGSSGALTIAWSGATDVHSGVASYKVVSGATSPASCAVGTVVFAGSGSSTTHSGLKNGTEYGYRICAIDAVGNMSAGVAVKGRPAPEYDGPVGSVVIAGGAAMVAKPAVTLALSATDASAVKTMCVSNTAVCTSFVTYATSLAWTLASGSGPKTVSVWFKDEFGNVSSPTSAATVVDMTPPTNAKMTVTPGSKSVTLSWQPSVDVHAGVASYKLVYAPTSPPLNCTTGNVVYSGPDLAVVHTGLAAGTVAGYRLCATDGMGNVSGGTTAKVVVQP
ncbi:MAG: S8 family serine peptidase [Myxococcales bacterium]|nr:S8 family serine peptidase [Myxococcales bacterium]